MKVLIVIGGVIFVGFFIFANELGKYAEEINPYPKDMGNDFDDVEE